MVKRIRRFVVKCGLRVLKKTGILSRVNFTLSTLDDTTFFVPIAGSIGYDHFFEKETWLLDLLKKILPHYTENDYFFDVGVNIGQTLLKVKSLNRKVNYIGFEPNPNCLYYLHKLLRSNDFQNVTIYPFALSNQNGVFDLELYNDHPTDSSASIVSGFREKWSYKIKVPVLNASEVERPTAIHIGLLKIDVEGGELEVVKGLLGLIQRDRPVIICEVLPVYTADNLFRLERQNELEIILRDNKYSIAVIDPSGVREIVSIGIHSDLARVNYLFFPQEERGVLHDKVNLN